ncbi:MAG TPA: DddA-like double-stranded DNA deaminase toxin [Pseudonocardiaceae bacterium]|jgi:hypothetical protein
MKRLFGWVVLIALVVFGVSYVTSHWPTDARFGCGQTATAAVAHADTADCPASVGAADNDATWAQARLATIRRLGDPTDGLFYDKDGHETHYTSARNADSDTALRVGRAAGVFPATGRPNIVDHVEVKAAAAMRAAGVRQGVMVINYPGGPCAQDQNGDVRPASCLAIVSRLLPAGASLVVWWPPRGGGPLQKTTFSAEG